MYIYFAAVSMIILITAHFLINNIIIMLCNSEKEKCSTVNYRGKAVPAIGGIVFIPILLVAILLLLMSGAGNAYSCQSYLALVLSMGFIGVIDDILGDKRVKGLANHFKSIFSGTMTTGFLKAFVGLIISGIISLGMSNTFVVYIVNVLIISLSANTINLFDLRPGRAVKVFLTAAIILLVFSAERFADAAPLLALVIAVLMYTRYDLREVCMLGDTGANILGITLGYFSAILLGYNIKLLLLVLLTFFNIMSERLSISVLIESSRLLSFLDNIGRGHSGNK